MQSCRKALELNPELAEAHNALGVVLLEQRDWAGALVAFRRAIAAKTTFGGPVSQAYHCANQLCDWSQRADDESTLARMVAAGVPGIAPFGLLSMQPLEGDAALLQRRASLIYADFMMDAYLAAPPLVPADKPVSGDRLRIGYLSADFHDHATMHLLRGVLAAHDKSAFAIHGLFLWRYR